MFMRALSSQFLAVMVAALAAASFAPLRAQESRPDDATPIVNRAEVQDPDAKGEGVEQDDPAARLAWQRAAWGLVTPAFRSNALKEGRKHTDQKNAPGPKWVNIGPFGCDYEQNGSFTGHVGDSGRARTILPHPTNPDVVYFLTSGGGLWRTNNWTAPETTWTPLTDDLPTTGGGSVAFGRNPNTLYLGLGDPYDQILVGGSMVKTKDGGVNWGPMIELGNAISVRDVKVDTGTNRDIVMVATNSGLYRSADEGDTYAAVATFNNLAVWSLARTTAGWLASAQPCPAANNGLQCGQPTTLYLSTDRGATWAPISNAGNVFSLNGRTTLAVAVPGDSVIYAYSATQNDGAMRDVYRSADGGQTWVANGVNSTKIPANPVAGSMPNMNICHGQCWYNQSILVDPRDPARNTVWIGGDLGTAKTTNGGSSWTIQTWWLYSQVPSLPYAHADHHANAFKMTGTPTIILGDDGGLNVSTDDGLTFSSAKNNGLATHLYYTVAGNPQFPNLVIGGLQDNGTRVRTDNGGTHNQVIGGDGMGAAYSQANTNTVIGSSQGSGMRTNLSNNAPETFQNAVSATAGLNDIGFGFFTAIVPAPANLDPTGRVFFHFSAARVWRSTNGGLNWTLIASALGPPAFPTLTPSPGLPTNRQFRSSPYNLGVSPTDLNRIAVGAAGGFLDISTTGGASWTDVDLVSKVPGYLGFVTNVTWQDNQNLWITSVAQPAGAVRVVKGSIANPGDPWSTATWTAKQNGLPDLPITRVYFDPRDASRNTIYAATHVGIYSSTDGGANWAPFGNGLPTVRVNDIYMPPDGSFMRIATYGRGIWEMAQLELASASLSDSVSSCDADGVLDNGETGLLTVSLRNQGPNNVNHVTLNITSGNAHVTFPDGNVLYFPPVQKSDVSTGSIRVALDGAAGLEAADFQIAISSPELAIPPFNVVSTFRVNYDEQPQGSATESVESANPGWTISGSPATMPNIVSWQRRTLSPTQHVWFGPDNNGQIDGVKPSMIDEQILTSPVMHVGTAPFVITFQHRFAFEFSNTTGAWDGGVIEISNDGGSTWSDIGTNPYNGSTNAATNAPIGRSRRAFISRSAGWPNFVSVTCNLGTTRANQDVMIRFRIGADEGNGAPGWDIDNIAVTGITNTPFTALVPETGGCTP
jgi:photosystem II stability/assembly factor-like uncharacterized protein